MTKPLASATSLLPLLKEVKACRLCEPDLPLGAAPLLLVGSGARILIAGQAPGRRAHESRVPFSDASGDRLRDWPGVDAGTFYDRQKIAILPMLPVIDQGVDVVVGFPLTVACAFTSLGLPTRAGFLVLICSVDSGPGTSVIAAHPAAALQATVTLSHSRSSQELREMGPTPY